MTERQFDITIARAGIKEARTVKITLGDTANEVAKADLSQFELRFSHDLALTLHHVRVAKYLTVDGPDELLFLLAWIARKQLEGIVAVE
jgi:hypothetical protein